MKVFFLSPLYLNSIALFMMILVPTLMTANNSKSLVTVIVFVSLLIIDLFLNIVQLIFKLRDKDSIIINKDRDLIDLEKEKDRSITDLTKSKDDEIKELQDKLDSLEKSNTDTVALLTIYKDYAHKRHQFSEHKLLELKERITEVFAEMSKWQTPLRAEMTDVEKDRYITASRIELTRIIDDERKMNGNDRKDI